MTSAPSPRLRDLTRYQWTVLLAAWLGWGFDAFDALLFNHVAPQCIPTLLHLPLGGTAARDATLQWTGLLTALLLIGWAVGGILFGRVADRIGRSRTLLLTMLVYSLGTGACALVPNLGSLAVCRFFASLGIGGEWAAGAAMVAEAMPPGLRVEAGALLYTAAPMGIYLAEWVSHQVNHAWMPGQPEVAWRYVFAFALLPALVALVMRTFVHESEAWSAARLEQAPPRIAELFDARHRRLTFSGASMAMTALLCWWSCNAFFPTVTSLLGQQLAPPGLTSQAAAAFALGFRKQALQLFNLGGLVGTLLTIPVAHRLGRRFTFGIYFVLSSLSITTAFGADLAAGPRLAAFFVIGMATYGVLGSFTYYLPELFPTRLRATGSGFCYNVGRILTAAGPFVIGHVASQGRALQAIFWVGALPLVGVLLLPWVIETRSQDLAATTEPFVSGAEG